MTGTAYGIYGVLYAVIMLYIGISTALYKTWTRSLTGTFVAATLSAGLIEVVIFIPLCPYMLPLIGICLFGMFYPCFFIYRCLQRMNNLELLREKKIWLPGSACLLVIVFFCLLFKKNTMLAYVEYIGKLNQFSAIMGNAPLKSGNLFSLLSIVYMIVLAPVFEEITGREIVFSLIVKNVSTKKIAVIIIIFSALTSLIHLNRQAFDFLLRFVLFAGLFLVRFRFRSNSQLWYCVCIHSLWNTGCFMYAVLTNTFL